MKNEDCKFGFIGFGHMAQSLFLAMDRCRLVPRSQVLFLRRNLEHMRHDEKKFGISSANIVRLTKESDILFLCVRPPQAKEVLEELARLPTQGKKVISILAGTSIASIRSFFKHDIEIIRAMPNMGADVGEAMTILSAPENTSPAFLSTAHLFFKSMGQTVDLPEAQMDLATGMAGSGPGFLFALIEAAARLGEKGGIPYEKALLLMGQTFLGAGKLIVEGKLLPQEVIQKIAVPGGTTEAGLKMLKELHMDTHFQRVIEAAAHRAYELSKGH
jgi:pyrroline-5-carboxylate reductase